jgi:predicted RNA-binding Zn ribbon-like protein
MDFIREKLYHDFLTDSRQIIRDSLWPMVAGASPRAWVLPEESAPVRLMSTVWADTEGPHDDFARPGDVNAWLEAVGVPLAGARATDAEFADALRLRDAVRRLAAHVTGDTRDAAAAAIGVEEAVATLNEAAGYAAGPRLAHHGGQLRLAQDGSISRVKAGLAEVAEQSIHLLGGGAAHKLRACYAPGCVLYFVQSHPRREWCSVACGNRVRAARHYQRARARRGDQA